MKNPHENAPVLQAGANPETAKSHTILIHGRGATAHSMFDLANVLGNKEMSFYAPQATMNQWYPNRFIVPREANEPWLTSALDTVDALVNQLRANGVKDEQIAFVGFSQGACLAAEYVARNPSKYGGLAVFSGGLIGAEGEVTGFEGSLEQTPIFLGCSDVDFHIPVERVHESRDIFEQLNADVTERIYPNMGHTINEDEITFVRDMLQNIG